MACFQLKNYQNKQDMKEIIDNLLKANSLDQTNTNCLVKLGKNNNLLMPTYYH